MTGEYGNISYRIRTNMDIPWAIDEERICEFSVCPFVDLNNDRRLKLPVVTTCMEIESRCFSCTSFPLELKVICLFFV